jgi:hypothetical protein
MFIPLKVCCKPFLVIKHSYVVSLISSKKTLMSSCIQYNNFLLPKAIKFSLHSSLQDNFRVGDLNSTQLILACSVCGIDKESLQRIFLLNIKKFKTFKHYDFVDKAVDGLVSRGFNLPFAVENISRELGSTPFRFGEDAFFYCEKTTALNPLKSENLFPSPYQTYDYMGVADGVGGWRDSGVDPSIFPWALMNTCTSIISSLSKKESIFMPVNLLDLALKKVTFQKIVKAGSSTVCLALFDRAKRLLHGANIGDSGLFFFSPLHYWNL